MYTFSINTWSKNNVEAIKYNGKNGEMEKIWKKLLVGKIEQVTKLKRRCKIQD